MNRTVAVLIALFLLLLAGQSLAETRLVGGYSDGFFSIFAEIEHNGVRYRTDQLGSRTNQLLWERLSPDDRRKIGKIYGFAATSMEAHFGSDGSQAIRDWFNDDGGWTALWKELKDRHAEKDFPELTAAFGPDVTLDLPDLPLLITCWEVRASSAYNEAYRLVKEIEADFAIGREVYHLLRDANWDQVEIATKALAKPLIKIIIDTFVSGFVVKPGASVTDLQEKVEEFVGELLQFLEDRYAPGKKPPSAAELIKTLDQYIADMEETANTAARRVREKTLELESLVAGLEQQNSDCLEDQLATATEARETIEEQIDTLPAPNVPTIVADPVPGSVPPDEVEAWIFNNRHDKATAILTGVLEDRDSLDATLDLQKAEIQGDYWNLSAFPGIESGPYARYYDGMTSGFDRGYRRVMVTSSEFNAWDLAALNEAFLETRADYVSLGDDAETLIDDAITQIDPIQALALGLDAHAGILGTRGEDGTIYPIDPLPSVRFNQGDIRDLAILVDILAPPGMTLEQRVDDLDTQDGILDATQSNMDDGIGDRLDWIDARASEYDSLVFNYENSLSLAVARLTQITGLHEDPYFEPWIIYRVIDGIELRYYRIAVSHILGVIASAGDDPLAREVARQAALRRLFALHGRESTLVDQLVSARDSHLIDAQALRDFRNMVIANYEGSGVSASHDDFEALTGRRIDENLWLALVPDITYFHFGEDDWIQPADRLLTNLMYLSLGDVASAYGRISGKTETWFELYELYQSMKQDRDALLALSEIEFNAFMTQTTIARDALANRLLTEGVYGVGWPSLELIHATNHLQESINLEYRSGQLLPPIYWEVSGLLKIPGAGKADEVGAGDVDLVLEGEYDNGVRVAFPATSGLDGKFSFEFVANGSYLLSGSIDAGAARSLRAVGDVVQRYVVQPTPVEVRDGNVFVNVDATPTPDAGYVIAGTLGARPGQAADGQRIVVRDVDSDEVTHVFSFADGSFALTGIGTGSYEVYPAETALVATPESITVEVPPSRFDLMFLVDDAERIFADGFEQASPIRQVSSGSR